MSNKRLHVERVKPEFSISESGLVSWKSSLTDYDASLFYRGKTVSNDEFNTLFLNKTYQGNYLADSLTEFFKTHLPEVISRRFRSQFDLHKSFVKVFDSTLWGNKQEDGYYYITIPATEHGITPPSGQTPIEGMNVDTEMYLLDTTTGTFYEVPQVETDINNTVQIYTDDNTLSGFVVIRSNDKSFVLAEGRIDVSQIDGLAPVAISGNYEELKFRPDDIIAANTNAIASIISDTVYDDEHPFVHKADYATQAEEAEYAQNLLRTGTIQNIPISEIFEEASRTVKNATTASNYDAAGNIASTFIRVEDKAREVDRRVEGLILGEETVKNAENAEKAILNADSSYSGFIQDPNGVLKVGDEIVEKKVLIYEAGELTSTSHTVTLSTDIVNIGDKVEIEYKKVKYNTSSGETTIYTAKESMRKLIEGTSAYPIAQDVKFAWEQDSNMYLKYLMINFGIQNAFIIRTDDDTVTFTFNGLRDPNVFILDRYLIYPKVGEGNEHINITKGTPTIQYTWYITKIYKIVE